MPGDSSTGRGDRWVAATDEREDILVTVDMASVRLDIVGGRDSWESSEKLKTT